MDGVFMRKIIKFAALVLAVAFTLELFGLVRDKNILQDSLIRLHVVAASDTEEDQAVKLQVRDAVIAYVEQAMANVMTVEEAKAWLRENLPGIADAANAVLEKLGLDYGAAVTFQEEAFPVRDYETFSLPSGVYSSLRITLGRGQGHNWWCVVFPSLCLPAVGESADSVAAGAGFSDSLTGAVTGQKGYRLRFYFLDVWGKIENYFFHN